MRHPQQRPGHAVSGEPDEQQAQAGSQQAQAEVEPVGLAMLVVQLCLHVQGRCLHKRFGHAYLQLPGGVVGDGLHGLSNVDGGAVNRAAMAGNLP
ncbi:hypothetical protein D3C80_1635480 [compost metagenome]